ncbi:hypothetical protein NP493_1718g00000 [Ridgeia piscesae]|uniref:Late endosomal/lysosomal adaptor and MAPK and MTOR activator 4 n=1 Tax=Ridgeia piscesae TaxID=27915 RepID=A0AAD9JU99_RIDPI|nr:hypothetical protein NP493_1718g00000 [Ridgeia piscesae]
MFTDSFFSSAESPLADVTNEEGISTSEVGHGVSVHSIETSRGSKALDSHKYVAAILMDLTKAFDCLPHSLLLVWPVQSGGDLENDEVMADQLMRLTRVSLKVLQSSNSSANFRRLSVIWDDFQYVITVSNHRVFVCKRRPDPVV